MGFFLSGVKVSSDMGVVWSGFAIFGPFCGDISINSWKPRGHPARRFLYQYPAALP
jgi:hypothetical protein